MEHFSTDDHKSDDMGLGKLRPISLLVIQMLAVVILKWIWFLARSEVNSNQRSPDRTSCSASPTPKQTHAADLVCLSGNRLEIFGPA